MKEIDVKQTSDIFNISNEDIIKNESSSNLMFKNRNDEILNVLNTKEIHDQPLNIPFNK